MDGITIEYICTCLSVAKIDYDINSPPISSRHDTRVCIRLWLFYSSVRWSGLISQVMTCPPKYAKHEHANCCVLLRHNRGKCSPNFPHQSGSRTIYITCPGKRPPSPLLGQVVRKYSTPQNVPGDGHFESHVCAGRSFDLFFPHTHAHTELHTRVTLKWRDFTEDTGKKTTTPYRLWCERVCVCAYDSVTSSGKRKPN